MIIFRYTLSVVVNGGSDKRSKLGVSKNYLEIFPMKNGEPFGLELRIEFPSHLIVVKFATLRIHVGRFIPIC